MSDIYKMQRQGQETAITVKEETPTSIVQVICDPYECNRDCGNRAFMASYNELGLPTPKAPCMPNEKE